MHASVGKHDCYPCWHLNELVRQYEDKKAAVLTNGPPHLRLESWYTPMMAAYERQLPIKVFANHIFSSLYCGYLNNVDEVCVTQALGIFNCVYVYCWRYRSLVENISKKNRGRFLLVDTYHFILHFLRLLSWKSMRWISKEFLADVISSWTLVTTQYLGYCKGESTHASCRENHDSC